MKVSDYIVSYLASHQIKKIFLVVGGACSHIVDSIGKAQGIDYVCTQHEQAAGMAAEAYSRITGNFGVAVATSGPGTINLLGGVSCAYFDSIPCLFISGQVNINETKGGQKIRQLGFQETDIVKIVKPITKYAYMVKDPKQIKYHLDKALFLSKTGRGGPVWLDIPLNVQHAQVDPKKLKGFNLQELKIDPYDQIQKIQNCLKLMSKANRPIILIGAGIRLGNAVDDLKILVQKLRCPVVTSWGGIDILPHNNPYLVGPIGVYGLRGANFAIQNCDFLLSIGSRLDSRQTGGQYSSFAREAIKIIIDIDKGELKKNRVKADLPIYMSSRDFLQKMNKLLVSFKKTKIDPWLNQCREWKMQYMPVSAKYYQQKKFINPYVFIKELSRQLTASSIIACDIGAHTAWTMQAFEVKNGQRLFSALGFGPMGYGLPGSIGASFASTNKNIICITGDGGMQLNIQELQTIAYHKLPVKIFILNNKSYGIIKQFQEIYFEGRFEGSSKKGGYSTPDFVKVAKAYKINTLTIKTQKMLRMQIQKALKSKGPIVIDVMLDENQKIIPKLEAIRSPEGKYISRPIEDQIPYLPRDEFLENMIITPLQDSQNGKKSA